MLFGAPGSQIGYFHEKVPILGEIDFAKFRSRSVHRNLKIRRFGDQAKKKKFPSKQNLQRISRYFLSISMV